MNCGTEGDDDEISEGEDMDDNEWINDEESGEEDSDNDDSGSSVSEDEVTVEIFTRTFHNGDYDAEFDDALGWDRGVFVANNDRPTQASYNKPDNWRERNRDGLEKVKEMLQNFVDLVSHDQTSQIRLYFTHNDRWFQLGDNEEPIVWHDEILDEYWDRMEARLHGRKQLEIYTDIRDIEIENVEITKDRLATLVTALSGQVNTTEYIQFNNVNLCEEGIIHLSKLVDVSSQLQRLIINHNRIDNMDSVRCLSRSLKSHTRINQLNLAHCDLGSSPEILSAILRTDIEFIILDNNNIDSLGADNIAEYLGSNPPIVRIDLECNRLNDHDAILISQALMRNTNLKTISLHSNNFTSIGVKALLNCVFESSSLNSISASNHTLVRMIIFSHQDSDDSSSYSFCSCIDGLLNLDRTQKVMLALQDQDCQLQYLANVPVELMPEVLAFPLRQVDQCRYLNILYSTMRWWNMPLLYSYHCSNDKMSDRKRNRDN
jgi:hypothetical protein